MATAPWTRSSLTDAGQVLALIEPVRGREQAQLGPLAAWCDRLVAKGELTGAVRFIAHALPRYDCIVWAVRAGLAIGAFDRADPAIIAVLQWLDDPSDALRRAAAEAGEAVPEQSPVTLLCQAVFMSGGSIVPEDLAPVQPPADTCAKLASAAVLLGAYACADPKAALRQVIELGEAAACGQ